MVADLSEVVALEGAMQVMVDLHRKGDKAALQKHIAVALSRLSRLNEKRDSGIAPYRDQLGMFEAVKSKYKEEAVALDETRYSPVLPVFS